MQPRIVITGLGTVMSIGTGRAVFWDNLLAGHSGIGPVESFDTHTYKGSQGGEVKDFRAEDHVSMLKPTCLGRASQFAAAARIALADALPDTAMVAAERAGVSMGTTSGEPHEIERFDDHCVDGSLDQIGPEFIASYPCHVIPSNVASELGFAGINMMIPTACAAGNYVIAHAYDVLRSGRADIMLAGGPDATNDAATVKAISQEVRKRMQDEIDAMLKRRRSIFYGSLVADERV